LGLFDIFWLATKHLFATEANFSLHRIKNQVGWGGRVFDIEFSKSGRTDGPLISREGRAFVAKRVIDSRWAILVTRFEQRSKNFLEFSILVGKHLHG
jgi:hypothetical protein